MTVQPGDHVPEDCGAMSPEPSPNLVVQFPLSMLYMNMSGKSSAVCAPFAHGSLLHNPPEQPNSHACLLSVYEQLYELPDGAQVPAALYVILSFPLHAAGGGEAQGLGEHGLPRHAPLL